MSSLEAHKIDFKYYLYLTRKNFLLFFLFFMTSISIAFLWTIKTPRIYQAQAQISLDRSIHDSYLNEQIETMTSSPLLQQVVNELDLDSYFQTKTQESAIHRLRKMVLVERVHGSPLLNVRVTASEPIFAAAIANTLSRVYIRKNFESVLYHSNGIPRLPETTAFAGEMNLPGQSQAEIKSMTQQELRDSLPSVRNNSTIQNLSEKKASLEADLNTLLGPLGEGDPQVMKARSDLKRLEDRISSEKRQIGDGFKTQAQGAETGRARISQEALAPKIPISRPRTAFILMAGLMSLLAIFLIIFLLDYFDDTLHSLSDLERNGIVLPILGPIPLTKNKKRRDLENTVLACQNSQSEMAESFRDLCTSINFSSSTKPVKTLVFTSCRPREGKSFICHNIAASIAVEGAKTLLVDANLKQPEVHRIFKLDNASGLSSYLASKLDFDAILKVTHLDNLRIVTAGPSSPNPGTLLGSPRMKEFLETAQKRFERIIIDCPSLIGIGDGLVIGRLLGHLILVMASGKTPIDLIRQTQSEINKAGIQITGVVLNRVNLDEERFCHA